MSKTNLKILLIEDDIDDVELLKEALTNTGADFRTEVIMEGDLVAPFLEKNAFFPDIIVMDLNLPKLDGREIMKYIKASRTFQTIPLVVLSTSSAREDIDYSQNMGANRFITKPVTMEGWDETGFAIIEQASL